MRRGYQIIDLGLGLPELHLSPDTQVRCLSYLMKKIDEIVTIPLSLQFDIVPAEYLGGPYPVIGMYAEDQLMTDTETLHNSLSVERQLRAFIEQISLDRLSELSSDEVVTWRDILSSVGSV